MLIAVNDMCGFACHQSTSTVILAMKKWSPNVRYHISTCPSCPKVYSSFIIIIVMLFRLRSHKHEYESGTVQVPVYEFRQTRVCMYFNVGRSHTYDYGLPVNFTHTSSFCTGGVLSNSQKVLVNSDNIIYENRGAYLTSELTSS